MESEEPASTWSRYYCNTSGRALRPLFVEALERLRVRPAESRRRAIDLGCGAGTETLALLGEGWEVLAIDQQPEAISLLEAKVPPTARERLRTAVVRFEEVELPPADFIYAGLSLPFCPPGAFPTLWKKIEEALRPDGWFAGHFFGERDGWANREEMTFFSRERCRALFDAFVVEQFEEIEREGPLASGLLHQRHAFEVIARRAPRPS